MKYLDVDYLIIAVLLLSGLYAVITGLVMDLFGSPQFFWHSYAGYVSAALAGLHLALNWGRVTAYLRRRFKWTGRTLPSRPQRGALIGRRGFVIATLAGATGFLLGWLFPSRQSVTIPDEVAANYPEGDVGQFYHHWSKPGYALASLFNWGRQPARFKTYLDTVQIALPDPHGYQGLSLEQAIERRRSRREFSNEPMFLVELSRLLHAATGITDSARGYRAAPSAGALYPIETYLIVHNVEGLEPGAYHYNVADHALEQLQTVDLRTEIVVAGIGQEMLGQAQICFVLSAIFQRTRWKYRERSYRYVLLEAGHIGQNLYLAATSMGLGACAVGAFLDDNLNDLLGLDGEEEAAIYLFAVGKI